MGVNKLKTQAKDPTDAVLGSLLTGETLHIPLSTGPHWLVCGQTGSGKSVALQSILVSMMAHAEPSELIISWIDPKKVEATAYIGLPYCPIKPVTDMGDAYGLLAYLVWLMDERYSWLSDVEVKNLIEFNDWVEANPELAELKGYSKMPYFVCVIDEYADMVMQEKTVEDLIVRLAQKARAAGIHLLIATQRPSADIISPTIKSNVPGRICLKVLDSVNSMIVLDEAGGEKLRGYGDGLVKQADGSITRFQGPYISNDEIAKIFAYLTEKYPQPDPIDYKQIVVNEGLCQWIEDYDDSVPSEDRHVQKVKRSRW